ncbi:flagellar basal body-associated FliL family protein [Sphingomonadaceae bacterium LXI357]|uniref:Flagellar protein FliL n=2 Tax=Stakelama marina TaxID=2826939 RepID=A0A8T4IAS4_9SPHN|nr:flagellar basal body-associated FliL family protein [Stakelama marina]
MMFMGGDKAAAESDHGSADEGGHGEAESGGHGEGGEASFVDVPPMVVNLRTSDGQARFLKLHFLIVPSNADKKAEIEEKMPLIIDRYQPFLRELRPEDLAGSAAVYRIKEELILRAGEIVGTGGVSDVLIQDLIQQ